MRIATPLLALLMFACGSSTEATFADKPTGPTDGFGDGGALSPITGDGAAPLGGNQNGCSEAAKLVYVVTDKKDLYSFKPDTLTFTKIGTLNCPSGAAEPNSMAIDRTGAAWLNYSDGALFKASTADATCVATSYVKNQGDFGRMGMAFATDTATGFEETLYVVGIDGLTTGKGLGKIDLTTMTLTKLGEFTGNQKGKGAELTGTGDARLFGFFTTSPSSLAQIDKTSAATSGEQGLGGVNTGNAYAFSFWGGDFWFYTSQGSAPSVVTRKQTSTDGAVSTPMADVGGFRIVGAGVSTCAPITPPR